MTKKAMNPEHQVVGHTLHEYKEMLYAGVSACNSIGKQHKVENHTTPLIKSFSADNRLSAL